MARYIDAEKIKYHKLSFCGGHGLNCDYTVAHKHEVDAIPTADVVPKSEVKNLQDELDLYEFVYGVTPDKQKVIGRVRSDVAREVFEKIEDQLRGMFDHFRQNYDVREAGAIIVALSQIAELKKKYTEGE